MAPAGPQASMLPQSNALNPEVGGYFGMLGLAAAATYNHRLFRTDRGLSMNKIVTPSSLDASTGEKITVHNPVGYPPKVNRKAAAPRPESLDGKTIYLVDCRFDDSVELLKHVQGWFAEHMP